MQLIIFDEGVCLNESWYFDGSVTKRLSTNLINEVPQGVYLTNLSSFDCCKLALPNYVFLPYDAFSVSIQSVFFAIYNCSPVSGFEQRYQNVIQVFQRVAELLKLHEIPQCSTVSNLLGDMGWIDSLRDDFKPKLVRRSYNLPSDEAYKPVTLRIPSATMTTAITDLEVPFSGFKRLNEIETPFLYNHDGSINDFYLDDRNAYCVYFTLDSVVDDWLMGVAQGQLNKMLQPEFSQFVQKHNPQLTIKDLYISRRNTAFNLEDVFVPVTSLSGWLSKYIANQVILDRVLCINSDISALISSKVMEITIQKAMRLSQSGMIVTSIAPFEINGFINSTFESTYIDRFNEIGVFIE